MTIDREERTMSGYEQVIAKITSTMLGVEDHGIMTAMLHVSYGGGGAQGIGGYALDAPHEDARGKFVGRVGSAYGMEWVARCMRACGVSSWEQLPGRTIYVLFKPGSHRLGASGDSVLGIENLPTEPGERFIFADLWDELGDESETA